MRLRDACKVAGMFRDRPGAVGRLMQQHLRAEAASQQWTSPHLLSYATPADVLRYDMLAYRIYMTKAMDMCPTRNSVRPGMLTLHSVALSQRESAL